MTGKELEILRVRLDITRQQFSWLLGITPNSYSRLVHGRRPVKRSIAHLALLLHAFGADPCEGIFTTHEKG